MSEATAGRCMACGGNGEHALSGLTVRTLHVRGIGGEKRVQALGGVQTGCVCRACAEKQLEKERNLFRVTAPRLEIFAGIALLAVLALVIRPQLPDGKGRLWLIISAVMLAGALLAAFGTWKDAADRKKELAGMTPEAAEASAAWQVFLRCAPRKDGQEDLTYIPLTAQTAARKKGDLALLYNLLPEIAVQAYNRIHSGTQQPS